MSGGGIGRRVFVVIALSVSSSTALAARAVADVTADAGGNTVTVGASNSEGSQGLPGHPAGGSGGRPGPACFYTLLPASEQAAMGIGGLTPGAWYSLDCAGPSLGLFPGGVVWRPAPASSATSPVSPTALAMQAIRSLVLPTPSIHVDPPGYSVVNLATWLWVDSSVWHPLSATAIAGRVSATAVATPRDVTWQMGDGSTLTCVGPGTPYRSDLPANSQHTRCSYIYRQPSIGQPSVDGDPNNGAFPVSATIRWTVTWFAVGAPGGGVLPSLHTIAAAGIRVEQVESIGTGF